MMALLHYSYRIIKMASGVHSSDQIWDVVVCLKVMSEPLRLAVCHECLKLLQGFNFFYALKK